jgi:hypothetical protein
MGGFLNVSENRLYLEERLAIRKAGAFMRHPRYTRRMRLQ